MYDYTQEYIFTLSCFHKRTGLAAKPSAESLSQRAFRGDGASLLAEPLLAALVLALDGEGNGCTGVADGTGRTAL